MLRCVMHSTVLMTLAFTALAADGPFPPAKLDMVPKPLASDPTVKLDYDIVYVRAPRYVTANGKERPTAWPEIAHPTNINAGYDLMLLHPDGSEEVLVPGGEGSIADPYVSFDAQWVYYAHFYLGKLGSGSDIYKVRVKDKKVVRLTHQEATPNSGCLAFKKSPPPPAAGKQPIGRGVFNLGPCPLPSNRVAFTSTRDQVRVPRGYPRVAHQIHVMDEDGGNVEKIGHINIGSALHPVVLKDGRVMFSTLESQGVHGSIAWGIWSIHPDGTNWEPIISALYGSGGADDGFHFQSQLSDGSLIVELYYNQNTQGFGTYVKLPPRAPAGVPQFGPAYNPAVVTKEHGWEVPHLFMRGRGSLRMPFQPYGLEVLTRFTHGSDFPAPLSDEKDPKSQRAGKVTHPCGAPDNHLLTIWSPGSMPSANRGSVQGDPLDVGIYLIKGGKAVMQPGDMLLIKNDPKYNEQWPRPLVPYKRVYGVDEPARLPSLRNDGALSKHLPEGTPFGLVGSSSLYKRESFPRGQVPKGSVTAKGDPYAAFSYSMSSPYNWGGQGADAGLYENSDIHAIRILAMEPATIPVAGRFHNHAWERLRILGEIPVRHFPKVAGTLRVPSGEKEDGTRSVPTTNQPLDPDGNPDTSFLAKIPADVAFTFQTIDKNGMVLNMAQTWHQVRPGEIRNNCGGCHAHSQQPTPFEKTAAARPDYTIFDLTKQTPLLTTKEKDESKRQWDVKNETGVRYEKTVKDVEYHRDVKPIFERSCVACHSHKLDKPAGKLALDDDRPVQGPRWDLGNVGLVPSTYNALAGHYLGVTRYARGFQARRSMLIWKIFGERLDGFPATPAKGQEAIHKQLLEHGDFKTGSIMPPPEAVKSGKVKALTDEDKRTLVRWIDLGCPIDFAHDPKDPGKRGDGWFFDDQRPTLAVAYPRPGKNDKLDRIVIGMHDYYTGLDMDSLQVTADFPIDGAKAGDNLAPKLKAKSEGVFELRLASPIGKLADGKLTIAVKDRQGNVARIERVISVGASK